MFEITEPATQRRIEIGDDPRHALAFASPRFGAHFVLDRLQALVAHEAMAGFEPVTQEVESSARLPAVPKHAVRRQVAF